MYPKFARSARGRRSQLISKRCERHKEQQQQRLTSKRVERSDIHMLRAIVHFPPVTIALAYLGVIVFWCVAFAFLGAFYWMQRRLGTFVTVFVAVPAFAYWIAVAVYVFKH
jgi:hypothetical protein